MNKSKVKKVKEFTKFQKITLIVIAVVLVSGLALFFARHKIFAQNSDILPIPDLTPPQNLQYQIKYMDEDTLRSLQQPQ